MGGGGVGVGGLPGSEHSLSSEKFAKMVKITHFEDGHPL